jgi:hypothetical protein
VTEAPARAGFWEDATLVVVSATVPFTCCWNTSETESFAQTPAPSIPTNHAVMLRVPAANAVVVKLAENRSTPAEISEVNKSVAPSKNCMVPPKNRL